MKKSIIILLTLILGLNANAQTYTIPQNPPGISNFVVTTGSQWVWDTLSVGKLTYINRTYTFLTMPTQYQGLNYLQTSTNDAPLYVPLATFNIAQDMTVFIMWDNRISPPSWMLNDGWTSTGDIIQVIYCGNDHLIVYEKSFNAGDTVSLPGAGNGCSQYKVAVRYDSSPNINCTDEATNITIQNTIHDRVNLSWDDMNSFGCSVNKYRIKYREIGTNTWQQKTTTINNKMIYNLNPNTTYEYKVKVWYNNGDISNRSLWSQTSTFTTADACTDSLGLTAISNHPNRAEFNWSGNNYSFARLRIRELGTSTWNTIGGNGIIFPTQTKTKFGLTPATSYEVQIRTWCSPNGGPWNSSWSSSINFTTQASSSKIAGNLKSVESLTIYPNPSRDLFNISFSSEKTQDIKINVINLVGEIIYTENLQKFIGQYNKLINLESYTKGIYFLEIKTTDGLINKKIILQ